MEGNLNVKTPNRKSIRYPGVDYSVPGFYFITICIQDRKHHFGAIKNGEVNLSPIGYIARQCWLDIPQHFPKVVVDEFIIMPDHMHGIIEIIDNTVRAKQSTAMVGVQYFEPSRQSPTNATTRAQDIVPLLLRTHHPSRPCPRYHP